MGQLSSAKANLRKQKNRELTEQEKAAILEEVRRKQEDRKKEAERAELYSKSIEKMSHRQLLGELKRAIKREHGGKPPRPMPGLNIAYATAILAVLENTITDEVGRRPDQINKSGRLSPYPR